MTVQELTVVPAPKRVSLIEHFSERHGIEPNKMLATLKATVIRPARDGTEATNEQIAAFLVIANQHQLNPFTKEVHAFLGQRGEIVCVVGLDGWAKKMNEHPQFDGMDFEQDDQSCTCKIYRRDRSHPVIVTEYLSECIRETQPWKSHPKRMLRHKAMIQCARLAFSFAGIYDQDEAETIIEHGEVEAARADEYQADTSLGVAKIGAVRMRKIVEGLLAAVSADDPAAYGAIRGELNNAEWLLVWEQLRSWERSALKKLDARLKALPPADLAGWSLGLISGCADGPALEAAWTTIQDAYAENDAMVPAGVAEAHASRRVVLGAI